MTSIDLSQSVHSFPLTRKRINGKVGNSLESEKV
jgi:hypothetical protein